MRRFLRLSLAQMLLLMALAAFLIAIGVDAYRNRSFINANHPVLRLSPDGETLAMNCSFRPFFHGRHPVILKDTSHQEGPATMLEHHNWLVSDVAWSEDGQRIFSISGGDHTLRIWDAQHAEQLNEIKVESPGCMSLSPDEKLVALGGGTSNPVINIWDVQSKQKIQVLKGHKRWVYDVEFTPDGRYLVSNCIDNELRVWDTKDWQLVNTLSLAATEDGICFTSDGKLLAPKYREKGKYSVCLCEIPSGDVVEDFPIEETYAWVSSIGLSNDGKFLVAAHGGDRAKAHSAFTVWDFETKERLATQEVYAVGDNWIYGTEFSLDGETLFLGTQYGRVVACQWRTGEVDVIFDRPPWPWRLALLGGLFWAIAWRYAPKLGAVTESSNDRNDQSADELCSTSA